MQVPMTSNFTYMKSKNPPRIGRGCQPPRREDDQIVGGAHDYSFVPKKVRKKLETPLVMLFCVLFYSALDGGSEQGCKNAYKSGLPSAAGFLISYI